MLHQSNLTLLRLIREILVFSAQTSSAKECQGQMLTAHELKFSYHTICINHQTQLSSHVKRLSSNMTQHTSHVARHSPYVRNTLSSPVARETAPVHHHTTNMSEALLYSIYAEQKLSILTPTLPTMKQSADRRTREQAT